MLGNPNAIPDSPIPQNQETPLTRWEKVWQAYFLFCMACSQALLMFLMTPMRIVFRENQIRRFMKPLAGVLIAEGRRSMVAMGEARQLIEAEKRDGAYQIPCFDCGVVQQMPAMSMMCLPCAEKRYGAPSLATDHVPMGAKCFTAACDLCRVTLPREFFGGTVDEVDAEATKLGWRVEGSHFTCPACLPGEDDDEPVSPIPEAVKRGAR
jgi:hypothetical protein